MAFKEVSRVEATEMVRRWQAGASVRGAACASGLSRTTIRGYILPSEGLGLARDGPLPTESQVIALLQLNVTGRHPATIYTEAPLSPRTDQIHRWLKDE